MDETISFLLDTHIALWIMLGDKRLEPDAFKARFQTNHNQFIFHQTSLWEIQIKYDIGKLKLPRRPGHWIYEAVLKSGMRYERIEDGAIFALGKLPPLHRDPFDRLLIAHALTRKWTIITADQTLDEYPIEVECV